MAKVLIKELQSYKKQYAVPRKTLIDNLEEAVVEEKKIEELDVVFLMDRFGYAKTVDVSVYERNKEAADTENRYILTCKNTDKICIFTNKGQMHLLKVLDLPYGKFRDKGIPIDNLSNYNSSEENFIYIINLGAIIHSRLLFGLSLCIPEELGYVDPHLVLKKEGKFDVPVYYRMNFDGQTPRQNHFSVEG